MTAVEINFDGLVGPTHNYGGLSHGNVASMASGGDVSNPQAAALQGLEKMRTLLRLGIPQGVLPPHERPYVPALRALGFAGTDREVLSAAAKTSPLLLRNVSSSSAMWTANAATVSPSADTADGRIHFTPANLSAMLHRSIEPEFTGRVLETLYADETFFAHHHAVPGGGSMGDEGAANHGRMAAEHGSRGIELFVYGFSVFERLEGWRFRPRQALEASEAIIRAHELHDNAVLIRQSKEAVEAGAFHNDVVAVANGTTLLYHEKAFENPAQALSDITAQAEVAGWEPQYLCVTEAQVPLGDAIRSYLFNSQLVSLPDGRGMALILPGEAERTPTVKTWVDEAIAGNGPIAEAHFLDLHQSMKNGGGPACLRLRVAVSEKERTAIHAPALLDEDGISALEAWVRRHYRDRMSADDLGDPHLLDEVRTSLDDLTGILGLGSIYDFQR